MGRFYCGVAIMLLLSSCSPEQTEYLRVGANQWIGNTPLFVAQGTELFEDNHIRVTEISSASDALKALADETLDVASLTLDEALTLLAKRYELKIIWVIDVSVGADVILAKPQFDTIEKLKGKIIAVEASAVGALMLDAALKATDLSVSDVKIRGCPLLEHMKCYEESDAVVTFEPLKSRLLAKGAVELFSSKQIPERIIDVLVARKEIVESQSKQLKALVQGFSDAVIKLNKQEAHNISLAAQAMQLSREDFVYSMNGIKLGDLPFNRKMLSGKSPALNSIAERLQKLMLERQLLANEVDLNALIDNQFLPED